MKPKIIITAILALLIETVSAQENLKAFIDSIAGKYIVKNSQPALVIGINNNNGAEELFFYGRKEKTSAEKPDSNSIFEIGDITQVFTTILFADMSIKGEINDDDELQKYLPFTVKAPVYQKIICKPAEDESHFHYEVNDYKTPSKFTNYICFPDPNEKSQPIRLCYLATHSSGLPENPSNLNRKRENYLSAYNKENLYDFLRRYEFKKPIGFDYRHSHLGIALLGHALTEKSGKTYEQLVKERICHPLGLSNTVITLSESQDKNSLQGYTKKGKPVVSWVYDVMAPSGGLLSNANDMMKFLAANIGTHKTSLNDVLDYTHNTRLMITDNKKLRGTEVALGWLINRLGSDDKKYVWIKGTTNGFASFVGFVETSHTGVVVLSSCRAEVQTMAAEILKKLNTTLKPKPNIN